MINSSVFDFEPVPEEFLNIHSWYEEGKIHRTLSDYMVRSKSEVIIANMLYERDIPFKYEVQCFALTARSICLTSLSPGGEKNGTGSILDW